jgi:hypothetical protein
MEAAPAVPNDDLDSHNEEMSNGELVAEGWLYKLSSSHMAKDKFQKRWFMLTYTQTGGYLSYCPSQQDRTTSKEPLVRKPDPWLCVQLWLAKGSGCWRCVCPRCSHP